MAHPNGAFHEIVAMPSSSSYDASSIYVIFDGSSFSQSECDSVVLALADAITNLPEVGSIGAVTAYSTSTRTVS